MLQGTESTGAKPLHFATGLRSRKVLRPLCLGVIHEIIHCLCSWVVFLINYHLFSSLSLPAAGSAAAGVDNVSCWSRAHWLPKGMQFASVAAGSSDGWVHLESDAPASKRC